MGKIALILHGWPQARTENFFLSAHLREKGYKIIAPDMFSRSYVFSPENIETKVEELLEGERLDVAIGVSLGGLILPHIAKKHPESKLIFIASGPYLRAESWFFNVVFGIFRNVWILRILSWVLKLPVPILTLFYKLASPFSGTEEEYEAYKEDMLKNIEQIKSIPPEEEEEIIRYVYKADNTQILGGLKNKALIFNGRKDLFMPAERGERLHKLLANSKLIINSGEHFDAFTLKDLDIVDEFVGS